MKKTKFLIIALIAIMLVSFMPIVVNAVTETYTATSTINGIEVSWEYNLNDEGEIINLVCTNKGDLTGNITIPSTLDGKTVVTLGTDSFRNSKITGVVIPDSVRVIECHSFDGCTNLTSVDLGSVEKISFDVFKGCTSLTELTIPNTLKKGAISASINNKNVTSITFEDGLKVIPSNLCENTGISSVVLPDSVKSVENNAFANCTNLTSVDLGKIDNISFDVFKGCTSLTELTIPKTLKTGSVSPSINNKNVTKITFEDGLTIIPTCLCQNTGISEVKIPDSVKSVGYDAFAGCSNLEKVDLGRIEALSFDAFKNCPKLTSIFIPNTLVGGDLSGTGIFTGTTNLTSVTFEDGIKEIPAAILKKCSGITEVILPDSVERIKCEAFEGTSITELEVPESVQEIEYYAFKDCKELKKITIYRNCTHIGWFTIQEDKDSVFNNHDEDLTIYCYRGSKIVEYAQKMNIKYVYLDGEGTEETTTEKETKEESTKEPTTEKDTTTKPTTKDTTTAKTNRLPQTGVGIGLTLAIIAALGFTVYSVAKYKKII